MDEQKQDDYVIQFNVITYTPSGQPLSLCYYAPGRAGFTELQTAQNVIALLEKVDIDLNRRRVYEIQQVVVSENYGVMPEINFDITNEEEAEINAMIDEAQVKDDDGSPPLAN